MTNPKYLRDDLISKLAHFTEEAGEALMAVGKTQRWGLASVNPELPPEKQETNEAWLLRELDDVIFTAMRLRQHLIDPVMQKPKLVDRGVPRRIRLDMLSPLELEVRKARAAIESAGCDVRLTNAGNKVQEALELIADWVERE